MSADDRRIRLVAIGGSARKSNFTGRALALAVDELAARPGFAVERIDAGDLGLSYPGGAGDPAGAARLRDAVEGAAGVLLATPEYHGGFSALMKLAIENLGFPSKLQGKPVALLGVAAGTLGAVKSLEQLRSVCSHVGALVLPGTVSVAGVDKLFDEAGACLDPKVERRIRGGAASLADYIERHVCPGLAMEAAARGGER